MTSIQPPVQSPSVVGSGRPPPASPRPRYKPQCGACVMRNSMDCAIDTKPVGPVLCVSGSFLYRFARFVTFPFPFLPPVWPCAPASDEEKPNRSRSRWQCDGLNSSILP